MLMGSVECLQYAAEVEPPAGEPREGEKQEQIGF
jgi:hypothetical protein